MKKINIRKKILLVVIVAVAVILLVPSVIVINGNRNASDTDLVQQGYVKGGQMDDLPCAAITPECGVCNGKVFNGYCYTKQ